MEAQNVQAQSAKRVMVIVPGKECDRAFWPTDVRYIEGVEQGSRVHLFAEDNSVTLFTTLSVREVVNAIHEVTMPSLRIPGPGPTHFYYQPDKAVQP